MSLNQQQMESVPDFFDNFEDIPSCLRLDKSTTSYVYQKQCIQRFNELLNDGQRMNMFLHDMKGGYLREDCGSSVVCDELEAFPFIFPLIAHSDVFVYFSHHTISIPPNRWIRESHNHSKIVLGTVLFENENGVHLNLLADGDDLHARLDKHAKDLVQLMEFKCFDGYLINVEVKLTPSQINNLIKLIDILKCKIKETLNFEPILVWYDAVTTNGELKWQNAVTPVNKIFFEKCGLILLNYSWTDNHLKKTAQLVSQKNRVFVGIDVFGRHTTYGPGSTGCADAMQMIEPYSFSNGVFAPGYHREVVLDQKDNGFDSVCHYWEPVFPYLKIQPILFLEHIYIGQYFRTYDYNRKSSQELFYRKDHVFPLSSDNKCGYSLLDNGINFRKKGRYLLQVINFQNDCKIKASVGKNSGVLLLVNKTDFYEFSANNVSFLINVPSGNTEIYFIAEKDGTVLEFFQLQKQSSSNFTTL